MHTRLGIAQKGLKPEKTLFMGLVVRTSTRSSICPSVRVQFCDLSVVSNRWKEITDIWLIY